MEAWTDTRQLPEWPQSKQGGRKGEETKCPVLVRSIGGIDSHICLWSGGHLWSVQKAPTVWVWKAPMVWHGRRLWSGMEGTYGQAWKAPVRSHPFPLAVPFLLAALPTLCQCVSPHLAPCPLTWHPVPPPGTLSPHLAPFLVGCHQVGLGWPTSPHRPGQGHRVLLAACPEPPDPACTCGQHQHMP